MDGIRPGQPRAGQRQPGADRAGQARQHEGRADIGEQRDRGLGHRHQRVLGHHARAVVDGHADATPHADAVDQADPGLGEGRDAGVDGVFLGEEGLDRRAVAGDGGSAHGAHVAAGAEGAPARALQHHQRAPRDRRASRAMAAAKARIIGRSSAFSAFGRFISSVPGDALAPRDQAGFGGLAHGARLSWRASARRRYRPPRAALTSGPAAAGGMRHGRSPGALRGRAQDLRRRRARGGGSRSTSTSRAANC